MATSLDSFVTRNPILDYTLGSRSERNSYIRSKQFRSSTAKDQTTSDIDVAKNFENLNQTTKSNLCIRIVIIFLVVGGILLIAGIVTFCVLYYGVMTKTPSYKDACSLDKPCAANKGLLCDLTCKCGASTYWDGFTCANLLAFGSLCYGGSFQCQTGLSCINNLCQCPNTTYYANGQCITKLGYGSTCAACSYSTCSNCFTCAQCADYLNMYCDTSISRCTCPVSTHYFDTITKTCRSKVTYNFYCDSDTTCLAQSQGLYCQPAQNGSSCPIMPLPNFCNCPLGTYFNGSICKAPETYYSTCTANCTCDASRMLYCDTIDYKCLCPQNYYWETATQNCTPQFYYNVSCTSSNQCLVSKGLGCVNGICQCSAFTGNWYWSPLTLQCVECPTGWIFVSAAQRCIKAFYDLQTWTNAQFICIQNQGNLLIFNDTNLLNVTKSLGLRTDYNYWLGGGDSKNEGTFRWTFDGTTVSTAIMPWCGSQPDGGYYENCLGMTAASWCIFDTACSTTSFYFCQKLI